jgi:hypothetical protein
VIPAERHKAVTKKAQATNHIERFNTRVHLDLSYTGPPTTGGHGHGHVTVRRSPDPPHGGPGFDPSHRGGVAALGLAL